jgi:FlaA1/EpsC-like NDP-sugar epimerase
MQRFALRASQATIDIGTLALALALAFVIRFDGVPSLEMIGRFALTAPYVVCGEYLVLVFFGVPRFSWRFVGLREMRSILWATTTSAGVLFAVRLVLGTAQDHLPYLRHGVVPFGVIAMNGVLSFLGTSGVRVLRRLLGERLDRGRRASDARPQIPTLLVGAGQAGVVMAREIANRPDLGVRALGFLDDDLAKHGTVVHGIPVLGRVADLPKIAVELGAQQILVTLASAPGKLVREIVALAESVGLPAKIMPGLWELASGSVSVSRIRDVAIEDLLGRAPVHLDTAIIDASVSGRTVLVTGAGGSIGSEICRQLVRFRPAKLVLVERTENALFQIHRELIACELGPTVVLPAMADVTDGVRMRSLFIAHRPHLVLHAAAHKHVPMMEDNPGEALKNNVGGTVMMAQLAEENGVDRFVMISTDKAVNPSSVMGATKRFAETFVQALSANSTTKFVTVRFGNVLGSAGSVIPIFREQIKNGGPITVTHPEMRRYFMTIPEACQLVLQAGAMGEGGEIFVLDMGEPVKIVDLARDLIALSGLRPGDDIEIRFTGTRPGEKLFEEIATDEERAEKTRHPQIFTGKTRSTGYAQVRAWVDELPGIVARERPNDCVEFLRRVVPEYKPAAPLAVEPTVARALEPRPVVVEPRRLASVAVSD